MTAVAVATAGLAVPASASESRSRPRQAAAKNLATLEVDARSVEVKPARKSAFVTAKDGRKLKAGDTVRTSPTGQAQITYSDGSLTRLDSNTEYRLVKLANKEGTRQTTGLQNAGRTWHRVEKLTGSESYRVEGANATAAVLGTAFVVTCVEVAVCSFTAVIDEINLTPEGAPRTGPRTVTLTPGGQATVDDGTVGPAATLTQEELLAIQWITPNLLQDAQDGKSPGTSEIGTQTTPPPTRPPSSPVVEPPPPAPAATGTGDGTGDGTGPPPPPANRGPIAVDDAYTMFEDTLLVIAAPGVIANDTDPDGDLLSGFLTSAPVHGAMHLSFDSTLIYFPDANFHGVDSYTYAAGDGQFGSTVATVTITVLPVNDAPVAMNDSYTTAEDTPLVVLAPGVLGNDTDVDGNALTAVLGTGPTDGALDLSADGSFTYTPDADFHGTDTFTYRAFDDLLFSGFATVTITVNPPVNCTPTFGSNISPELPSQGQNVTITITATSNPCNLELSIPGVPVVVGHPGTTTLQSANSSPWVYLFDPDSNEASGNTTITFTVIFPDGSDQVQVAVPYQPGGQVG